MPSRVPILTATGDVHAMPVYDVDELAELLGTSTRTVRRRVAAGIWPHVRGHVGHRDRLLFTAEHVRLIVAAFNESNDYPAH